MNPAPLPQPSAHTCPNCGAPVDGNPAFCPRCGAQLKASNSGGMSCLTVLAQLVLLGIALILGLAGACFVLVGGFSISGSSSNGESIGMILGGGVGLAIAAACIWGIIRLSQRK